MWRRFPASLVVGLWLAAGLLVPAGLAAQQADSATEPSAAIRGPLPLRTLNPFFLMFLRMSPGAAELPEPGHGDIGLVSEYTSLFRETNRLSGNTALIDGEIWRNTLRARIGLLEALALSVDVPTLYAGGGFLDSTIEDYHDIFGFHQEGRDKNPDDQFGFLLIRGHVLAYRMPENELDLGDVALTLDWLARAETDGGPAVVLRAALELPTGDEERGFGNGELDGGFGLALEKAFGRYRLYGSASYQIQGTPSGFRRVGVRTRDTLVADLTAERPLGRRLSLLLQLGFEEAPIEGIPLPPATDNATTLALALSWIPGGRWRLDFAFLEDLDGESVQDFTAHLGVAWSW